MAGLSGDQPGRGPGNGSDQDDDGDHHGPAERTPPADARFRATQVRCRASRPGPRVRAAESQASERGRLAGIRAGSLVAIAVLDDVPAGGAEARFRFQRVTTVDTKPTGNHLPMVV